MVVLSLELCTPLDIISQDKLGVQLWEYERYAGNDWGLPKLVGIECIDCHVGRQAIELRGLKAWATAPLSRVSEPQKHTLITHYFAARVMCLGTANAIYYSERLRLELSISNKTNIYGTSQSGQLSRKKYIKSIKNIKNQCTVMIRPAQAMNIIGSQAPFHLRRPHDHSSRCSVQYRRVV